MEAAVGLLLIVILFAVFAFVSVPLRERSSESEPAEPPYDPRIADLEARKEAKYREIRDAELDHAGGKLSDADFKRQDAELRREAIEILKRLDELRERERV
jgi:hypothetical protein